CSPPCSSGRTPRRDAGAPRPRWAIRIRAVRRSPINRTSRWLAAGAFLLLVLQPGTALAQLPGITPKTSITPTRDTGGWVYWMAEGAIIIGAIILVGVALSYLRFSPKFFGREEAPRPAAPGARPPLLARQT